MESNQTLQTLMIIIDIIPITIWKAIVQKHVGQKKKTFAIFAVGVVTIVARVLTGKTIMGTNKISMSIL